MVFDYRDQQLDDFLTENFTTSLIGPLLSAGFQKFTTAGEIQYRPVYQHTKFSFESSWNFLRYHLHRQTDRPKT